MLECWGQKSWRSRSWIMSCSILRRWIFRLDKARMKVPSVMDWLLGGAWGWINCGGIPQNKWAKGRLIVLELHSERSGLEEDWEWGRKACARGFSDISGEVWRSHVVVLPFVKRWETCFESYIRDVGCPKRLFPLHKILVWESIVYVDANGVVLCCVRDLYNIHGLVEVKEQSDQVEIWGNLALDRWGRSQIPGN